MTLVKEFSFLLLCVAMATLTPRRVQGERCCITTPRFTSVKYIGGERRYTGYSDYERGLFVLEREADGNLWYDYVYTTVSPMRTSLRHPDGRCQNVTLDSPPPRCIMREDAQLTGETTFEGREVYSYNTVRPSDPSVGVTVYVTKDHCLPVRYEYSNDRPTVVYRDISLTFPDTVLSKDLSDCENHPYLA